MLTLADAVCSGWLKAVMTVSDAFVLRSGGLDALVSNGFIWRQHTVGMICALSVQPTASLQPHCQVIQQLLRAATVIAAVH